MTMRIRTGLALGALALLGGCVNLGGKPPKNLIALTATATAPAGVLAGTRRTEALIVLDPDTDRRLDALRVVVQVDEARVAYLQKVAWAERPARQFRRLLAETLRARGGQLVLEGGDAEAGVKAPTLSGRLIDMGYDARSGAVVVRFDAIREDVDGKITARRFESVVPGIAPKPKQVAPALNKAANDVAKQVADWVG